MYERYYGLRQRPFNLTSNPRYLLLTSAHAEALSSLQYGIGSRLGIIVLVGEAGTGKTTVIRAAMASQPPGAQFVVMNNPLLSRTEFFQHLAQGFGLTDAAVGSKTRFLSELTQVLEESVLSGNKTALIVDEAPFPFHRGRLVREPGRERRGLFISRACLELERQHVVLHTTGDRGLRLRRLVPACPRHTLTVLFEGTADRVLMPAEVGVEIQQPCAGHVRSLDLRCG